MHSEMTFPLVSYLDLARTARTNLYRPSVSWWELWFWTGCGVRRYPRDSTLSPPPITPLSPAIELCPALVALVFLHMFFFTPAWLSINPNSALLNVLHVCKNYVHVFLFLMPNALHIRSVVMHHVPNQTHSLNSDGLSNQPEQVCNWWLNGRISLARNWRLCQCLGCMPFSLST